MRPKKKRSKGFKSGEWGGPATSPPRYTQQPGKALFKNCYSKQILRIEL